MEAQIIRIDTHRPVVIEPPRHAEAPEFFRIAMGVSVLMAMLPFAFLDMFRASRPDCSDQDVADYYLDRRPQ